MDERLPFKIHTSPDLKSASLVVAWSEDAGRLGPKVVNYLDKKLDFQELAEIDPADFFSLGGVSVEDNVAHFPESKFYLCKDNNLVIFKSHPPRSEWYGFLNVILDIAEHFGNVEEMYTIGGMVSSSAHTTPRVLVSIANSPEMKRILSQYDIASNMDYETPPGQRPTLSSFLLWVARRRNIMGASLWVPVPFYLVAGEDPGAWRKTVDFLDRRFDLGIDFGDLDEEVTRQNEQIGHARNELLELDDYISRLERNLSLTADEGEKLIQLMEDFFRTHQN